MLFFPPYKPCICLLVKSFSTSPKYITDIGNPFLTTSLKISDEEQELEPELEPVEPKIF